MAASDYVPMLFKNRLHLAGRPQMSPVLGNITCSRNKITVMLRSGKQVTTLSKQVLDAKLAKHAERRVLRVTNDVGVSEVIGRLSKYVPVICSAMGTDCSGMFSTLAQCHATLSAALTGSSGATAPPSRNLYHDRDGSARLPCRPATPVGARYIDPSQTHVPPDKNGSDMLRANAQ